MINTIITDVGNVIYNERWDKVIESVKTIDSKISLDQFRAAMANKWDLYKVNSISKDPFWQDVAINLGLSQKSAGILSASFTKVWDKLDYDVVNLFNKLKNENKISKFYILSNSCLENEEVLNKDMAKFTFLDKAYFSHKTGFEKPRQESYLQVINDNKLIPSECLFIDDKKRNTDVAYEIGLNTILYTNYSDLLNKLQSFGDFGKL